LVLSGLAGAVGVVCLALAAHQGASPLLQTAAHMLLFHAPILLGIGILTQIRNAPLLQVALLFYAAGLVLFCGDLLLRALLEQRLFPMSAPIGGGLLILGWLTLALAAVRVRPR
jgi:uncharacterized membrane protein YgdD (TMEM256/DUF423 family)